jgi:glycosyltransferase involved in cell wall biosynthesis
MRTPRVTVLIDTYNYGQFVDEAVGSVLAQDFPVEEREILVVDDGSTDDTPERLRKFGDAIRYLRKPNGDQASAFNFGLERACGKLVVFLDTDDYWLPGKLRIVEAFDRHPDAGMVYHTFWQLNCRDGVFQDGGLPVLSGFLPSNTKELLSYVLYPTSFLAFRRSAFGTFAAGPGGVDDSGGRPFVGIDCVCRTHCGGAGVPGGLPGTWNKFICGSLRGERSTARIADEDAAGAGGWNEKLAVRASL